MDIGLLIVIGFTIFGCVVGGFAILFSENDSGLLDLLGFVISGGVFGFCAGLIALVYFVPLQDSDYKSACESMLVSDCDAYVVWVRPHMDEMNNCANKMTSRGTTKFQALVICLQNAEISPKDWDKLQ